MFEFAGFVGVFFATVEFVEEMEDTENKEEEDETNQDKKPNWTDNNIMLSDGGLAIVLDSLRNVDDAELGEVFADIARGVAGGLGHNKLGVLIVLF